MQPVKLITPGGTLSVGIESGGKLEGVPLQVHTHEGVNYVAGVPGARYSIVVRNLSSRRVEVITSIDGRNTLKNEEADYNTNKGLVLYPRATYRFQGWRVDDAGIRDFIFGKDISDSVVAQSGGDTANAGIIGIAGWQEFKPDYKPDYFVGHTAVTRDSGGTKTYGARGMSVTSSHASAAVAVGAAGGTQDWAEDTASDLSTGIGSYREDHVGTTNFTRGEGPDILIFRYMSYAKLVEKGIIPEPRHGKPDAFPGSRSGYEQFESPQSRIEN